MHTLQKDVRHRFDGRICPQKPCKKCKALRMRLCTISRTNFT
ncbi:unnamed protein product [Ixodes pacificus]